MTLYEFADIIGAHIDLTRYANQSGRWAAKFERCEVADGGLLIGVREARMLVAVAIGRAK
jgi:hypothetical protein